MTSNGLCQWQFPFHAFMSERRHWTADNTDTTDVIVISLWKIHTMFFYGETSWHKIHGNRFPPVAWQAICFHYIDGHWPTAHHSFRMRTLPSTTSGSMFHLPYPPPMSTHFLLSHKSMVEGWWWIKWWPSKDQTVDSCVIYLCTFSYKLIAGHYELVHMGLMIPFECEYKEPGYRKYDQPEMCIIHFHCTVVPCSFYY